MKYKTLGLLTILISCTLVHTPILKAQDPFDLKPLDPEIFVQTEQYLQQHRQQGKPWQTILEGVEFNNQSEIKIADEANVFTMLVRTGPSTAVLEYYTLDGELKWEKPLNFSPGQPYKISHELGYTGKRVLVSYVNYEDKIIKEVWDENGNPVGSVEQLGSINMAPSGNFYYPFGEGLYVHARFRIYDVNLNLITEEELRFLDTSDQDEYRNIYEYRVIDSDKLILMVYKSKKDGGGLVSKRLYIYDLLNRRLEFTKDLIKQDGQIYTLHLDESGLAFKDDKLVMGGFLDRNVIFLEIDLRRNQEKIHDQFRSYGQIRLSDDGKKLFEFGSREIEVYDLSRQTIERKVPLEKRISLILSMKTSDDSLWVTSIMYPEKTQKLTTFSLTQGRQMEETAGWFDQKLKKGILPVRTTSGGNTVQLIKLEQLNR